MPGCRLRLCRNASTCMHSQHFLIASFSPCLMLLAIRSDSKEDASICLPLRGWHAAACGPTSLLLHSMQLAVLLFHRLQATIEWQCGAEGPATSQPAPYLHTVLISRPSKLPLHTAELDQKACLLSKLQPVGPPQHACALCDKSVHCPKPSFNDCSSVRITHLCQANGSEKPSMLCKVALPALSSVCAYRWGLCSSAIRTTCEVSGFACADNKQSFERTWIWTFSRW